MTAPYTPAAIHEGTLRLGTVELPCYVLADGRRVLSKRGLIGALGMGPRRRGGGGDRIANFVTQERMKPFVSAELSAVTGAPIEFRPLHGGRTAHGYEARTLTDIIAAVVAAAIDGRLQPQQMHIARQCAALNAAIAGVGIEALVDEATGYQRERADDELQVKVQAYIAEHLQPWSRQFPPEFWEHLARLEGMSEVPARKPQRWGRYVMRFIYDPLDRDIADYLRENNPDPAFGSNHHQWLRPEAQDALREQITRVVGVMSACASMPEFLDRFEYVFNRRPMQLGLLVRQTRRRTPDAAQAGGAA